MHALIDSPASAFGWVMPNSSQAKPRGACACLTLQSSFVPMYGLLSGHVCLQMQDSRNAPEIDVGPRQVIERMLRKALMVRHGMIPPRTAGIDL
jgi:hypothetical protein